MNVRFRVQGRWAFFINFCVATTVLAAESVSSPEFLDEQFFLPPGFRIYRAAAAELSGGSYDLAFDGQGNLLVGDGQGVRRLIDRNRDGIYDSFEVMATGLGWRGPQGLLVYGDRLYAVGGDGLQLFDQYGSNSPLVHRGRLGNALKTGGDHEAHTILRGWDGYLYLVCGDGAGTTNRMHITEESSPVLFARKASVFRIDPDGSRWECLSTGGRNPPNLGMNSLGELFSLDSDMEWHVGLPWYRPVRLNHWAIGGDQGWQEVGAYPPYYLDCLPGILEIGRGSPNWGIFYEHNQLPKKYRGAYLVCDYRWKYASADIYGTSGRLLVFFLERDRAGWKARMEVLAKPREGARDRSGHGFNFALVDIEVAPDGSLLLSEHNSGIWRIYYDPERSGLAPPVVPERTRPPREPSALLAELLNIPQPLSEWSRIRQQEIRERLGADWELQLQAVVLDPGRPLDERLRALGLLSSGLATLPHSWIGRLARDPAAQIRGQAAWLLGIGGQSEGLPLLMDLLEDSDPFVRRRSAEALARFGSPLANHRLIDRLNDSERLIRYVAMNALAHRPTAEWLTAALNRSEPQIIMRALAAAWIRRELPSEPAILAAIDSILRQKPSRNEDRLDFLRIANIFQKTIARNESVTSRLTRFLLDSFPAPERDVRWEQARLLGVYGAPAGFGKLVSLLEVELDPVTQFHMAQSLARLAKGWTAEEEERLWKWILSTQTGWFADFEGKGVEFAYSWATVLAEFGTHHGWIVRRDLSKIDLASPLGSLAVNVTLQSAQPEISLVALYESETRPEPRIKILHALKQVRHPGVAAFLRGEFYQNSNAKLQGALLQSLSAQNPDPQNLPVHIQGLGHEDPDVVNACAQAIMRMRPEITSELAQRLIEALPGPAFHRVEAALVALSSVSRPGFKPEREEQEKANEFTRSAILAFWESWYEKHFGRKFQASDRNRTEEKSDEAIRQFILSPAARGGAPARGRTVYEQLQCHSCHGGIPGMEGRLFGPELAGIFTRLSRGEIADAIVYPSKQVADRFRATEVQLKDSTAITGFVTEQNDRSVTMVDRDQVRRIPRDEIHAMAPQGTSLMPERLLNRLSWDQIRDLLAFLEKVGSAPAADR